MKQHQTLAIYSAICNLTASKSRTLAPCGLPPPPPEIQCSHISITITTLFGAPVRKLEIMQTTGSALGSTKRPSSLGCSSVATRGLRRQAFKPACSKQPQGSGEAVSRREALLASAALTAAAMLPNLAAAPAAAAGWLPSLPSLPSFGSDPAPVKVDVPDQGWAELEDGILAYKFRYPTRTSSGKKLSMVLSHPPEKYSSAAPLSPDARQRIVSELFDLRNYVTVSMTVGPPSAMLNEQGADSWRAKDVAMNVLIDRSTARLSSGQRTALNDVEESHKEERDGQSYYVYEHVSQGSPTPSSTSRETYRHALAVTATRPGLDGTPYLYTLNLSCPQALWDDLEQPFREAVDSFRLTTPTNAYVPPDQNPWLFF